MSLNFFEIELFGDDDSEGKGKDKSKDGKNKGKGKSKTHRGKDEPYFHAKGEGKGKGKGKETVFHVFVHDMHGDLLRVDHDPASSVANFIEDCVLFIPSVGGGFSLADIDGLYLSVEGRVLQHTDLLDAVVASGQTVVINQGP